MTATTRRQRHFRIGTTVRFVTGMTGDVLPRAIVRERRGSGRSTTQYLVERLDTAQLVWTSGRNVHHDSPETEAWAVALEAYEAEQKAYAIEEQALIERLRSGRTARIQPFLDDVFAASGAVLAKDLYR